MLFKKNQMKTHIYILIFAWLFASQVLAENLLPNGSFEKGLTGWQTGNASPEEVQVIALKDGPEEHVVQIDARRVSWGERSVLSKPFSVTPSTSYEVRGLVKRLAGYGYRSSVAVVWKKASGQMIGVDNVWLSVLVGTNWVQESRRVIAPEGAKIAQIKAGIEMGTGERNAALFTGLELLPAPAAGPDLAIHLFAEKTVPGSETGLTIHITNTGDERLSDLKIALDLPTGMTAKTDSWTFGPLGAGNVLEQAVVLAGMPENDDALIGVQVTAEAAEDPVRFSQSTPVNLPDAKPVAMASEELLLPELPDMEVKLGAYYFPVMLDWGGGSRPGLRAIESMKPLLGYYDERSPEVADWHISWALQHGISWFAVDWYWNQGEEFINEALDEGLMNSRFFDQMKFCIHWCNQDPNCTTFRAYDYSPETLRELAATLCDRYFSRKNYLTVDGEPVFMIFQPVSLINDNGGFEQAKEALNAMEEEVRERGFKGLYFVAVNNSPNVPDYASAGFDCVAPYSFLFANLLPERTDRLEFDYNRIVQRYTDWLGLSRKNAHEQGMSFIPMAWAGWDDLPRYGESRRAKSSVTVGNTPAAFRSMAQALPDYAEKENPLVLIEAWNEWGEGTMIEPGRQYGFDYLSGLLNVLGKNPPAGTYSVPVPTQSSYERMQVGPLYLDEKPYAERLNADRRWCDGVEMGFESKRSLWLRPVWNMDYVWIENGSLHGLANGDGAALDGPLAIWLDANKVGGFEIRLKASAATRLILQWTTGPDEKWASAPAISLKGGEWETCRVETASLPGWRGSIYQFRVVFKDNPEAVEMDWLKTF